MLDGTEQARELLDSLIMEKSLRRIVDEVKRYASNPAGPDVGTQLQAAIAESGREFSEDDVIDAALEVGVRKDDVGDWLQEMASWLTGGPVMDPKPRPNPDDESEEEDDDDPDVEYCDCEDDCDKHEQCPDCGFCIKCCCECEDEE
jgi:hypothetical protein